MCSVFISHPTVMQSFLYSNKCNFYIFFSQESKQKKKKNNTNQNDYLEYFNFPLLLFLKKKILIQLELGNNDSV